MIKVTYTVNTHDRIDSVRVKGHSDSGKKGTDILCAGVSTAVHGVAYYLCYDVDSGCEALMDDGYADIHVNTPSMHSDIAFAIMMRQLKMLQSTPEGASRIKIKLVKSHE